MKVRSVFATATSGRLCVPSPSHRPMNQASRLTASSPLSVAFDFMKSLNGHVDDAFSALNHAPLVGKTLQNRVRVPAY